MINNRPYFLIKLGEETYEKIIFNYVTHYNGYHSNFMCGWKKNTNELEVFYTQKFIKRTFHLESSVINYDIEIPVITNKELKDINLDKSYNNDFKIINLKNVESYKGKFIKVFHLGINKMNVNSNFHIDQLKLVLTAIDDEVKDVTLPLDLKFTKLDNQVTLGKVSTLIRLPLLWGPNIPLIEFALRPNVDHSILNIETSEEIGVTHVEIGKSLTDDFNEINDHNLIDIDFNNESVFMQARYNTFFEVGIEYLDSSYFLIVFSVFITFKVGNDEEFRAVVIALNGVKPNSGLIYSYIDKNFDKNTLD